MLNLSKFKAMLSGTVVISIWLLYICILQMVELLNKYWMVYEFNKTVYPTVHGSVILVVSLLGLVNVLVTLLIVEYTVYATSDKRGK